MRFVQLHGCQSVRSQQLLSNHVLERIFEGVASIHLLGHQVGNQLGVCHGLQILAALHLFVVCLYLLFQFVEVRNEAVVEQCNAVVTVDVGVSMIQWNGTQIFNHQLRLVVSSYLSESAVNNAHVAIDLTVVVFLQLFVKFVEAVIFSQNGGQLSVSVVDVLHLLLNAVVFITVFLVFLELVLLLIFKSANTQELPSLHFVGDLVIESKSTLIVGLFPQEISEFLGEADRVELLLIVCGSLTDVSQDSSALVFLFGLGLQVERVCQGQQHTLFWFEHYV